MPRRLSDWTLDPRFIAGSTGRLFALHVAPRSKPRSPREAVLLLPPFAEEMNRSRRMLNLQARALAEIGIGGLILDPTGTGDSDGSFGDANWPQWIDDVTTAASWLQAEGYQRVSLLGLRLGACLALAAAPRLEAALGRIVLWQPVLRGQMLVNQFLRIRVAAGMAETEAAEKETVKDLRQKLEAGALLEVAGYGLERRLIGELDALNFTELAVAAGQELDWIEVGAAANGDPSPASRAELGRLAAQGIAVEAKVVPGESFWAIEEPAPVPLLLQATTALWSEAAS